VIIFDFFGFSYGKVLTISEFMSDKTIKRWLTILENMYVIFKAPPFHKNIARAIQKAPKFYFYDTGQVIDDSGIKLENIVACALQKEIHFQMVLKSESPITGLRNSVLNNYITGN